MRKYKRRRKFLPEGEYTITRVPGIVNEALCRHSGGVYTIIAIPVWARIETDMPRRLFNNMWAAQLSRPYNRKHIPDGWITQAMWERGERPDGFQEDW